MPCKTQDDRYAINAAYAEIREGYRTGDVERILAVYADGLSDLSDGFPSFGCAEAHAALRERLVQLFTAFEASWIPIIISIELHEAIAISHGWHTLTATPRTDGESRRKPSRFMHIWRRDAEGEWRLLMMLDNEDLAPMLTEDMVSGLRSGRIDPVMGAVRQPVQNSTESL